MSNRPTREALIRQSAIDASALKQIEEINTRARSSRTLEANYRAAERQEQSYQRQMQRRADERSSARSSASGTQLLAASLTNQNKPVPRTSNRPQSSISRNIIALQKEPPSIYQNARFYGGYAKLTNMGLLERIMNKNKAKATKAKPAVRKVSKPVKTAKPTRPVVRRRKPTSVRK